VLHAAGLFCAEQARDAEIAEKQDSLIRDQPRCHDAPGFQSLPLSDLCVAGFLCAKEASRMQHLPNE
jgi:hypothetical protein